MDENDRPNTRTPSTTSTWRYGKIRRAPEAKDGRERSEALRGSLLPWPRRRPLTIKVTYRGGPECWWQLEARGRTWRRPGSLYLHDVLAEVMAWHQGQPPRSTGPST